MSYIPEIENGSVSSLYLAKCIHVHHFGSEEKKFSLYCDNFYKSMSYSNNIKTTTSPRFSCVTFTRTRVGSTQSFQHLGQVLAIVLYVNKNTDSSQSIQLKFIVARLVLAGKYDTKNSLPVDLVTYNLKKGSLQVEIVPIDKKDIVKTAFIVPALDFSQMTFNNCGNVASGGKHPKNNSLFYVLDENTVECDRLLPYDFYLNKNKNAKPMTSMYTKLSLPFYLSIKEMQLLKETLNTNRTNIVYDDDVQFDDSEDDFD